jgi:hypothetical protein
MPRAGFEPRAWRFTTGRHGVLTNFSVNPKIMVGTNGEPQTMILITTAGKVGFVPYATSPERKRR